MINSLLGPSQSVLEVVDLSQSHSQTTLDTHHLKSSLVDALVKIADGHIILAAEMGPLLGKSAGAGAVVAVGQRCGGQRGWVTTTTTGARRGHRAVG